MPENFDFNNFENLISQIFQNFSNFLKREKDLCVFLDLIDFALLKLALKPHFFNQTNTS